MAFTPIETQDQLDAIVGERVSRAKETARKEFDGWISPEELTKQTAEQNERMGTLESQVKALTEERDALTGQLADKDAAIAKYEADSVKTKIAIGAGLRMEYASRLRGETEEEWEADAAALAKDFAAAHQTPPLVNPEPGAKGKSTKDQLQDWLNQNF